MQKGLRGNKGEKIESDRQSKKKTKIWNGKILEREENRAGRKCGVEEELSLSDRKIKKASLNCR